MFIKGHKRHSLWILSLTTKFQSLVKIETFLNWSATFLNWAYGDARLLNTVRKWPDNDAVFCFHLHNDNLFHKNMHLMGICTGWKHEKHRFV